MQKYLESTEYINSNSPSVQRCAEQLRAGTINATEIARTSFEYVRDAIRHCNDGQDEVLTASASDVLEAGTGYCYAKSHLLAALLRANGIPAAMCYQRLGNTSGHTIHGLNAVYLEEFGWYRIDARGNKIGVDAQFVPPVEKLAFELSDGEEDLPGFWSQPAPEVVHALTAFRSVSEARYHLPSDLDLALIS